MKKLLTLTMAGVCALAFAAAADAETTLRMKAPTVKTATRTQSNIVGSGNVEVQYVYSDWSTCATNYKTAEGGKYEVTTLYLGNLLTSQQVYDDLRDKFLTTEFDYTRTAMNGTSTQTVSKQQIGLLSTLVPSVADETLLTAVVSVGANYNGQSKGNNYYDFNSTSDRDGKFVYSDFATVSSSGILNDKVIPGRVASYTGIGTEAADLSAAANSNNGKVFSAAEAAAKADELKDLFYVSEKANWDNQQEANKIGVQNLVAKLQARYDEFTNAQMSAMGHVQDTLDAIVAGLANGTMSYADALAKLQGIIDGIKNFDKNGYNALLNDYANQLAALKNAYESNYAGTKLQLAKELQALKDSNAKKLADYTAQLAGELQALKTANAESLAALESNLSRELSVLKATNASAYKEAAANNAYQSGVAEVEASLAALKTANDKAEASKLAANKAQIAAKKDSNAKAEASKLAANNAAIAGMKTDNANKEAAKLAANNAALKAIDDKYAADKLALEKKAEAALAAFVLDQFTAMQNADNNAKLAELKAELTAYINSLKDSKGNAYSTDKILGYDTMQFNQVAYKTIAYNKKYSAADFAAEEAKGTFAVDEAEIAEVEVGDNQFLSALSVSSKNKVTMVDGVLQEVTTNTESLYLTSIYLEVGRKYISPIVLDLKGDGVLQASDGQHMPGHSYVKNNNIVTDFYGDGFEIAMEWVGPQDGLLVAPKADGSVDMSCLFGVAGGYESGYEKLSLYDKNNDDKVSGDELKGLSVWQDANSNGIADAGEVKTVQELGITSIGITNSLDFTSSFERNGQSYKMWDWWPNAVELIKVAAK